LLKKPNLEPNTKSIRWRVADYGHLKFLTLWLENDGHRISETGDRMWFYILSNAAMQVTLYACSILIRVA